MTKAEKEKLFSKMLQLEKLADMKDIVKKDYFEQANGAYKMLGVLGLESEYYNWAIGK